MSHLDKIVELRTMANPGLSEGSAVDTSARSNLNFILDDNIPQRINSNDFRVKFLNFARLVSRPPPARPASPECEPIPTNRRIWLDDHSAPHLASIPDINSS